MKKQDAKKLLDKLKSEKITVSAYVEKDIYEKFKKKCGKVPTSQVINALIKDFVEN